MTYEEICQKAVKTYGKNPQMDMVVEECSELIQAISKNKRGKDNRENIVEEIADVQIMIDQLKIIFEVSDIEMGIMKLKKLDRLAKRLGKDGV